MRAPRGGGGGWKMAAGGGSAGRPCAAWLLIAAAALTAGESGTEGGPAAGSPFTAAAGAEGGSAGRTRLCCSLPTRFGAGLVAAEDPRPHRGKGRCAGDKAPGSRRGQGGGAAVPGQ